MKPRSLTTALATAMTAGMASAATPPAGVAAFVHDHGLTRYSVALSDLDGDGRPEALIYAMATAAGGGHADLCGSGGCELYVLSPTPAGYRQVATIALARPPVVVFPTRTHGWHDLGVAVAGGGIVNGHEVRLRFDGHRYPSNPTALPAIRLTAAAGRRLIDKVPPVPAR